MRFQSLSASLLLLLSLPALAAGIDGRYHASIDGIDTLLSLQLRGNEVGGEYQEGTLRLIVSGVLRDGKLSATLIEPQRKMQIATLEGRFDGDALDATIRATLPANAPVQQRQARFKRDSATSSSSPKSGALDPKLIGNWKNESVINSGGYGNAASFATVRTLSLGSDGRISQSSQAAGGGGNWSYGSDDRKPELQGRWFSKDGIVHVQLDGSEDFKPATRYRFVDAYLVTENDQGKIIWQRR